MGKVKTKEDLNEDEVKRAKYLRNVLREQIYPLMCEIDGIEFVKVFTTSFLGLLRQAGLELADQQQVGGLTIGGKGILDNIPRDNKDYDKFVKLFDICKNENVKDVGAMLFGFESHINASLQRENTKRNLSTVEDFTKAFAE